MKVLPKFHDLPLARQLILWASRHWLSAFETGQMIPRSVWQSFAVAEIPAVYADLAELLGTLGGHELRPGDFEGPSSPVLNYREYRFLRFVFDEAVDSSPWPFEERRCPAIERAARETALKLATRLARARFRLDMPAAAAPPRAVVPQLGVAAVH